MTVLRNDQICIFPFLTLMHSSHPHFCLSM
ncbi:hypothetical protein CGLO_16886 [Colletotrichum gloeosporioides Cg-14]|uniref:Uncharacterized protein n=1 Tax=Colletotrichum gloeosporioides (strain Cg-14) TaxID=1237896 RepID=T0L7S0_COLGC|nr:hypothetical protein CGLO_16886 [Colletotrichum gloeosporioides Cg-14]